MEAASPSVTRLHIYETRLRHIQQGSNLHINCCGNLKSLIFLEFTQTMLVATRLQIWQFGASDCAYRPIW